MSIQGPPAQRDRSWNGSSSSNYFPFKAHDLFLIKPCAHKMLRAASVALNNATGDARGVLALSNIVLFKAKIGETSIVIS